MTTNEQLDKFEEKLYKVVEDLAKITAMMTQRSDGWPARRANDDWGPRHHHRRRSFYASDDTRDRRGRQVRRVSHQHHHQPPPSDPPPLQRPTPFNSPTKPTFSLAKYAIEEAPATCSMKVPNHPRSPSLSPSSVPTPAATHGVALIGPKSSPGPLAVARTGPVRTKAVSQLPGPLRGNDDESKRGNTESGSLQMNFYPFGGKTNICFNNSFARKLSRDFKIANEYSNCVKDSYTNGVHYQDKCLTIEVKKKGPVSNNIRGIMLEIIVSHK